MTGPQVVKTTSAPVIPAELHGFTVTVGVGVYPPDQPASHRKAMYAELIPVSAKARKALASINRERILGISPLTAHAAREIAQDPGGRLAEEVGTETLAHASRLARRAVGA